MTTYQEALKKEKRWFKRALIINMFHNSMLMKKKHWTMRLSAKRLGISLGAVSEGILLSAALLNDESLEVLNRADALKRIKS